MIEITIDIETIPDQTEGALETCIEKAKADFKAPSTLSKADAIADLLAIGVVENASDHTKESAIALWCEHKAELYAAEKGEELWRKTALDGNYGQIAVIGWKLDNGEEFALHRLSPQSFDEERLLQAFWVMLEEQLKSKSTSKTKKLDVKIIGHNVEAFDLPFLFKRSVINRVKPCIDIKPNKYSEMLFDTMLVWAGFNGRVSLDRLCKVLKVESPKSEITGANVWDFILQGKIEEVAEYCKRDVKATYEIYKRMTFAGL